MNETNNLQVNNNVNQKWNGLAMSRSELAILFDVSLKVSRIMIKELTIKNLLSIGKRRILRPNEIRIIIEQFG